jgi:hypothetical protein
MILCERNVITIRPRDLFISLSIAITSVSVVGYWPSNECCCIDLRIAIIFSLDPFVSLDLSASSDLVTLTSIFAHLSSLYVGVYISEFIAISGHEMCVRCNEKACMIHPSGAIFLACLSTVANIPISVSTEPSSPEWILLKEDHCPKLPLLS